MKVIDLLDEKSYSNKPIRQLVGNNKTEQQSFELVPMTVHVGDGEYM